ncbi:uncharacterized protein LOC132698477 [Cylas formicarius]|uniref:uncharacterized protein LOC132698477 n=1 Tax=Cylas formicarius TaxID=197179 RepID=UPI0029585D3E|nr:uncharacterized protein LOC132698477 [Cylas formicarius]
MKVTEKTYEEIITALSDHFAPRTSEVVSRSFIGGTSSPRNTFPSTSKSYASWPKAVDSITLRLCCVIDSYAACAMTGFNDDCSRKKTLPSKKAHDMCPAHEVAARILAIIKEGGGQSADVHDVNAREKVNKDPSKLKTSVSRVSKRCFRCEEKHSPDSCVYKNAKCKFCGKIGHVEHACFSKKKHSKQKPKVNQQSSESNFKNVPQNEHSSEDQVYHFSLNNVKWDSITGTILHK